MTETSQVARRFDVPPFSGPIHTATLAGIALLAVQVVQLLARYGSSIVTDDAFITFRYARNLAQGDGFVFNSGERVEGATTFLWTAILAACEWFSVDQPTAAVAISLVAGFGTVFVVAALTQLLLEGVPHSTVFVLAATIGYAAFGAPSMFVVSGMETTLFCFLVTLAIYCAARGSSGVLVGLVFGVAGLTRPEAVLYLGLFLGFAGLVDIGPKERTPRQRFSFVCWTIVGFASLYLPYFAWRVWYFGHLFPNTYYAKFDGQINAQVLTRGFDHLTKMIRGSSLELPLFLATIGAILRRSALTVFFLCSAVLAGLYICVIGGDFLFAFGPRLLGPVLPVLTAAAALGLALLTQRLSSRSTVSMVLAALFVANGLLFSWPGTIDSLKFTSSLNQSWTEIGLWLDEYTEDDVTIAVGAAGRIPYYSNRKTIDLLGLTDQHIAHTNKTLGQGIPGHEKTDTAYVLSRKPDVFVFVRLDPRGNPTSVDWRKFGEQIDDEYALIALARWSAFTGGPWVLSESSWSADLGRLGYMEAIYARRTVPESSSVESQSQANTPNEPVTPN